MRNPLLPIIIAIASAPAPVTAEKTTLDYAAGFDFTTVASYSLEDSRSRGDDIDQRLVDRIRHAVIRELWEAGLQSASSDPDMVVTFHLVTTDVGTVTASDSGADGVHEGWRRWGRAAAPTEAPVTTFPAGTLIVDAASAVDRRLIWRGAGAISLDAAPEKQGKQVIKILGTLGKRWKEIFAGQGK